MAGSVSPRFSLAERFEHGNFRISEVKELKAVSHTKFYDDVKAGLVSIEKHGRQSYIRGPVAKRYIYGDQEATAA